ncbi:MAG: hypothetical protein JW751_09770 [Polyangiaceae bacterium]|nr:hypothetical protein [Polyangiaceae bacterium]
MTSRVPGPGTLLAAGLLVTACYSRTETGAGEPFRVRDAQFFPGSLPGEDAASGGAGAETAGAEVDEEPALAAFDTANIVVFQGQTGKKFSGRVNESAVSLGMRLKDYGSGYWIVPGTTLDPQTNQLVWGAVADFDRAIPTGYADLEVVAFDAAGHAGVRSVRSLCITGRVPDFLNACEPTIDPPPAVISLTWDTGVDLDLEIITPAGRVVTPKRPLVVPPDDDGNLLEDAGGIDRDSNGGCWIDDIRFENLVFPSYPSGTYGVYANLFDACGKDSVRFEASVWVARESGEDERELVKVAERAGILLATQATGGESRGLFLFESEF